MNPNVESRVFQDGEYFLWGIKFSKEDADTEAEVLKNEGVTYRIEPHTVGGRPGQHSGEHSFWKVWAKAASFDNPIDDEFLGDISDMLLE